MDFDVVSLRVKIFLMEIPVTIPSPDAAIAMRDSTLGQMEFARKYTLGLLADVPEELWQRAPQGIPTHFAWQIGHLAVAQYGLMLFRQRGRAEGDVELMPGWFRKRYSRGTNPSDDPSPHPDRQTMLGMLERIHLNSMGFISQAPAELLLEPTEMPYAAYPIKLGALLFCPLHESIHSGQIGLLRRAFGLSPVR
jgi:hypothetical protein